MRKRFNNKMWFMALFLGVSMAGCGGDGGGSASQDTIGGVCVGGDCVSLGTIGAPILQTAAGYAILAKTGVDTVPTSRVTGNIGVSPAAASAITGFGLTLPPNGAFATSAQVTGNVYAPGYANPTPANLTAAVLSAEAAYTAAAAKPAGVGPFLNLGGGTVSGQTLAPGVYTWGTAITIPTNLILNGSATDVWVFQVAGTLDMAAGKEVILSGGAQAKNIFWQVADAVNIGANTKFKGIVLGKTSITFGNQASLNGRLLAQTAVNLNATTVTVP